MLKAVECNGFKAPSCSQPLEEQGLVHCSTHSSRLEWNGAALGALRPPSCRQQQEWVAQRPRRRQSAAVQAVFGAQQLHCQVPA